MDTKDILKMSLDEIVFMGRNKQYGGFLLRQIYGQHIKKGLIGGVLIFGLMVAYPAISSYIAKLAEKQEKLDMKEVVLSEPPPLDKTKPRRRHRHRRHHHHQWSQQLSLCRQW